MNFSKRTWIAVFGLIVFFLTTYVILVKIPGKSENNRHPNILFVLTDDLRWDAVGAYGNETVKTPNIDEFATEGMKLENFYVATPVCHPSRASFLTGRYLHQKNLIREGGLRIRKSTPTVASILNRAGYTTGFIGKRHPYGAPSSWHFKETPTYEVTRKHKAQLKKGERMFLEKDGETTLIEKNSTPYLINHARKFIKNHQKERWFLWLATNSPHYPYRYNEKHPYELTARDLPPGYMKDTLDNLSDTFKKRHPKYKQTLTDRLEGYYSEITTLDRYVGKLLEELDATNQTRKTLVILTSDNGIMHGSHKILGKSIWYDEATKVPSIIRWPGHVSPGSTSDALVSGVDFLPTLGELVGVKPPYDLEGESFLPIVEHHGKTRSYVFSEGLHRTENGRKFWYMIRGSRFKYVIHQKDEYLYDLMADPHEKNNLIDNNDYREVKNRLSERLKSWLSETS